nr:Cro/CI family transcriptional regulator [Acinetobacter sp. ANC 4218]
MKTSDVLARFNAPKVAQTLKITRQAVYQWGELVPEKSAFKLLAADPSIPHQKVA